MNFVRTINSSIKLWNALPKGMRVETSTDEFKKSLKTFLFSDVESKLYIENKMF